MYFISYIYLHNLYERRCASEVMQLEIFCTIIVQNHYLKNLGISNFSHWIHTKIKYCFLTIALFIVTEI